VQLFVALNADNGRRGWNCAKVGRFERELVLNKGTEAQTTVTLEGFGERLRQLR
jgi:hypothetical protein